jgi:uncharacterized protein
VDKLTNEFIVDRPIEHAWAVLTNLELIAPCMPGAQLQEIEGDVYRGVVRIKLGPITPEIKGEAQFVERDDATHRGVISAKGRDTGGKGNAEAMITAHLESVTASSSRCVVEADIRFTGKMAQFGRVGVLADVSKKLIKDFSDNLNRMLESDPVTEAPPAEETAPAPVDGPSGSASATAAPPHIDEPRVRKIDGPAAAPLELGSMAGPVIKRMLPAFGGIVVLLLLLRSLRRRK